MTKKKETRGRKSIPANEKVMPIQVYAKRSKVKEAGGIEVVRGKIKDFLSTELG